MPNSNTLQAGDLVADVPVTANEIKYASTDNVATWLRSANTALENARRGDNLQNMHIAHALLYLRTAQVAKAIKSRETTK